MDLNELSVFLDELPESVNVNVNVSINIGGTELGEVITQPPPVEEIPEIKFKVDASDKASKMAKVRPQPSMAVGEVNKVSDKETVWGKVIDGKVVTSGDFTLIEDGFGQNGLGGWVLSSRLRRL